MIVLDTNVVSELMRAAPAASVVAWVHAQPPPQLCTTSVSLAEVRYGIACLPEGRRKRLLVAAADEVFTTFADRVLAFDADAAAHYAQVVIRRERAGAPISGFDAQIAAVCDSRHATLATRNIDDFDGLGLNLLNPWEDNASASP